MAVSKARAADTTPFAPAPASPPSTATGAPKSLTVKLDPDLYAELRAYCFEQERATGGRVTHQEVMVTALRTLLSSVSGS